MENKIILGECVEILTGFNECQFDMIVTSPPYDDLRSYNGYKLNLFDLGKQCYRVLKDGSVCAVIIQDQTKNFAKSLSSFRLVLDWCDNAGFKLFETCIYKKQGVEGAWWKRRFRVDHEYIFLFLKGAKPIYFNKEPLKVLSKHGGKTMTGAAIRLKNGHNLPSRKVKINKLKCRGTIWDYTTCGDGGKLKHKHPATFPNMLPYDLIECFCPPQGVVLDPLNGSGTTCVAAKSLGRGYIGIDISKEYCDIATKRLESEFINRDGSNIKFVEESQNYLFDFNNLK